MMFWRKPKREPLDHDTLVQFFLKSTEFEKLSQYNGEVARGIMHTPEWVAKMTDLQRKYDEGNYEDLLRG